MNEPEADLHVASLKIWLKPADKEMLQSIAKKKDIPFSVLARSLLLRELDRLTVMTIPNNNENRRAA